MTTRKLALLFFLLTVLLLTACESEREADVKSAKVRKEYEEYVLKMAQQEEYRQYIEDVSIIVDDKEELKVNMGSIYQFHYHMDITMNDEFDTLTASEQLEVISSFNNLKSVKEEYGDPDASDYDSHDVLYIDQDHLHMIGKDDIYFVHGSERYNASFAE